MKVNFTKDELQLISDMMTPFFSKYTNEISRNDQLHKNFNSLEKKLERLLN